MTTDEISAMLAAATPGPWDCHYGSDAVCQCRSVVGMHGGFGSLAQISVDNGLPISEGGNDAPDEPQAKGNARLIAAAPTIAALAITQAEEIERLRAAVGILEDALQEAGDDYPGSSMQQWAQQQVSAARAALKEPKP
jgi:hypothetical protein